MGIRQPYIRVLGVEVDTDGPGRANSMALSAEEEEKIRRLTQDPDIFNIISRSIAPSIFGSLGNKSNLMYTAGVAQGLN